MLEQEIKRDILKAKLHILYQEYRVAYFNALFYGERLHRTRLKNRIAEVFIAITTPGFMGSFFLFESWIAPTVVGGLASLVAVLKSSSSISEDLERHTKLYISYNEIYSELEILVIKVKSEQDFTEETKIRMESQLKKMKSLAPLDDTKVKECDELKFYNMVNEKVPADRFWMPKDNTVEA